MINDLKLVMIHGYIRLGYSDSFTIVMVLSAGQQSYRALGLGQRPYLDIASHLEVLRRKDHRSVSSSNSSQSYKPEVQGRNHIDMYLSIVVIYVCIYEYITSVDLISNLNQSHVVFVCVEY